MQINEVIIGVGSNINPEENVRRSKNELKKIAKIIGQSEFLFTKPLYFNDQPDFLNGAFLIQTTLDISQLKEELSLIEDKLGRIREENKNNPRTIDLDIVIFNRQIVHKDLFERDFLQKAVKELLPDLHISN
jgi:2-amino-4-hydroxy-6-hydroxymethyldihydropteridine diphosphokinase